MKIETLEASATRKDERITLDQNERTDAAGTTKQVWVGPGSFARRTFVDGAREDYHHDQPTGGAKLMDRDLAPIGPRDFVQTKGGGRKGRVMSVTSNGLHALVHWTNGAETHTQIRTLQRLTKHDGPEKREPTNDEILAVLRDVAKSGAPVLVESDGPGNLNTLVRVGVGSCGNALTSLTLNDETAAKLCVQLFEHLRERHF